MRKLSQAAAHALAGAYVLGTLRGPARQRFEAMRRDDPTLAAVVRDWEAGLTPLAERVPPVEPPARVWKAIEARLDSARPGTESSSSLSPGRPTSEAWRGSGSSLWSSLAFWRTFGLTAGGLASVLLATFLYLATGPRGEPVFVAVLTDPRAAATAPPHLVVSMHSPDLLRVRMVRPWQGIEKKSLELWVLPTQGNPRSLGTFTNATGDTMITITTADPRVQGAYALAVSVEPPGGSPTGQPTGPVVASGSIAPVRRS